MIKYIIIFILLIFIIIYLSCINIKKSLKINTKFFNYSQKNYLRKNSYNILCDYKKIFNKIPNNRTIFISIASYRDDECPITIQSLLSNAKYPNRIFIGICQQNAENDIDCINNNLINIQNTFNNNFNFDSYKNTNIRINRLHANEAKGPTYARYLCSLLYNNEDYFLQLDSHMLFNKDWDVTLISYLDNLKNIEKPVITYYPKDWTDNNKNVPGQSTFCKGTIGNDSQVYLFRGTIVYDNKKEPREIAYCSGNFFFTYGCFLNEVPFDPNLPQLFEGEEPLFTLRMWTNGWNFYSPPDDICYHHYIRKDKPKYWDNPQYHIEIESSLKKMRAYLGMIDANDEYILKDSKIYGMGNKRTIQDYWKYIGFNKEDKTFSKNFC